MAGAGLRFGLQAIWPLSAQGIAWGTFLANSLGCFIGGLALGAGGSSWSPELKLFVMTGFLGSLTTLSSLQIEVWQLGVEQRRILLACLHLILGAVGGFGFLALGYLTGAEALSLE